MIYVNKNPNQRGKYKNAKVGVFYPKNKEKFKGNCNPIYKSKLEHKMMMYLDKNPNIIQWSYEKFSIKYVDKSSKPERLRDYHIDFIAIAKTKNGLQKLWIEVKQDSETRKPVNESDLKSMKIWLKNKSKWEQAEKTAKQNNAIFKIITEKQLN